MFVSPLPKTPAMSVHLARFRYLITLILQYPLVMPDHPNLPSAGNPSPWCFLFIILHPLTTILLLLLGCKCPLILSSVMNDFLKTWYPPYFFLKMRSTRNIIYHIFFVFKFLDDLNTKTWNALNSCCLHPKKLIDIFPNLAIIINVYPAIPVIICECEHFLNYP